ncbi:hypothetical protein LPJ61_006322, partial [Coemansia biformis]
VKREQDLLADEHLIELRRLENLEHLPNDTEEDQWIHGYLTLCEEVTTATMSWLEGRNIRAWTRWTGYGEQSTRWFYKCMRARNSRNNMASVLDADGNELTD